MLTEIPVVGVIIDLGAGRQTDTRRVGSMKHRSRSRKSNAPMLVTMIFFGMAMVTVSMMISIGMMVPLMPY